MRILYVVSRSLEINTSASIRNFSTISGLIENGHDVTVFSSEPDTNHSAYDGSLRPANAKIKYVRLGGAQSVARMGRKFKCLKWIKPYVYKLLAGNDIYDNMKSIINHVSELALDDYDLIISSSDPKSSHLFVDELFRYHGKSKPWIQIWGDPFADDITLSNKRRIKDIRREEERLLNEADKIVYVSKMTQISQAKKYCTCSDKMVYLPVPYYHTRISNRMLPKSLSEIHFCYCGDYNSKVRNLSPFYSTAVKMNLKTTICGLSDLGLTSAGNVKVYPRQSADRVQMIEDESDILIHLSNLNGTQIPGKIYQYVSTNRPILFILDGDKEHLREIFQKYNRFIFVDNDEKSISEALQNIHLFAAEKNNEPLKEFSASMISQKLLAGVI